MFSKAEVKSFRSTGHDFFTPLLAGYFSNKIIVFFTYYLLEHVRQPLSLIGNSKVKLTKHK